MHTREITPLTVGIKTAEVRTTIATGVFTPVLAKHSRRSRSPIASELPLSGSGKNFVRNSIRCELILRQGTSVCIIGNPGVGKTYLAKIIGWRACQANQRVLFTTAMDMLNHLLASQVDHSLVRKLKLYTEPTFLLVDELGYPQDVDPNKCTFITSFSFERDQWMRSKCINIHDQQSRVYELSNEYDGRRAVPTNFFMLLESYQHHPEAKSLGPNGKTCEADTRGLLQRAHIVANWPLIFIGKESDKHWEEGEDLSLLEFKAIEYKRKGYAIATNDQLRRISKIPKREFMRRGINQHTLEKICKQSPVRANQTRGVYKSAKRCLTQHVQRHLHDLRSDFPPLFTSPFITLVWTKHLRNEMAILFSANGGT